MERLNGKIALITGACAAKAGILGFTRALAREVVTGQVLSPNGGWHMSQ